MSIHDETVGPVTVFATQIDYHEFSEIDGNDKYFYILVHYETNKTVAATVEDTPEELWTTYLSISGLKHKRGDYIYRNGVACYK